jgi:hypothetical protein
MLGLEICSFCDCLLTTARRIAFNHGSIVCRTIDDVYLLKACVSATSVEVLSIKHCIVDLISLGVVGSIPLKHLNVRGITSYTSGDSKHEADNELSELLGFRKYKESMIAYLDFRNLKVNDLSKILHRNVTLDYMNILNPEDQCTLRVPIEDLLESKIFLIDSSESDVIHTLNLSPPEAAKAEAAKAEAAKAEAATAEAAKAEAASDPNRSLLKELKERILCDTAFIKRSLNIRSIEYFMNQGIDIVALPCMRSRLVRTRLTNIQSHTLSHLPPTKDILTYMPPSAIRKRKIHPDSAATLSKRRHIDYTPASESNTSESNSSTNLSSQTLNTQSHSMQSSSNYSDHNIEDHRSSDNCNRNIQSLSIRSSNAQGSTQSHPIPNNQNTQESIRSRDDSIIIHVTKCANRIKYNPILDYSFNRYGTFPSDLTIELKDKEFHTNLFLFFAQVTDISNIDSIDFIAFPGFLSYISACNGFDKASLVKEAINLGTNVMEAIRSAKRKCKDEIYYYHTVNGENKVLKLMSAEGFEPRTINFKYFFNNSRGSDFKITKGQESIFCHKQILSFTSVYFKELFNRTSINELEIKDEKMEYYVDYIKYLYYREDIIKNFYRNRTNQSLAQNEQQNSQDIDEDRLSFFINLCNKTKEELLLKRIRAFIIKNVKKISNNFFTRFSLGYIAVLKEYKDDGMK